MPKRFTFRLETVLRLRRTAEDECHRRVAARLRDIARLESDLRALDEQFDWEVDRSREEQCSGAMDVMALRRRRGYMGFLQRRRAECEGHLRQMQRELQNEQAVLAAASREVKVLEKLRERQWARHRQEEARRERIQEDEIAQALTLRTSNEERGWHGQAQRRHAGRLAED